MNVGEYLKWSIGQKWDWQFWDCCRYVDRWCVERGNPSPMAAIDMRYDSELSALRRIREGGGLAELWTLGMIASGIPEADDPRAGDVGIIPRPTECGTDEAAAIYTGDKWATLGIRGMVFGPAEPFMVWRP